jgi:ectoine hydroxylase-related dioxygenase (phytanoyl-CoA dioxygenase family)
MLEKVVKQQQQQQKLTTRTLATAAEAIETSQISIADGRPATAEMAEIVEMPTTVLTSTNVLSRSKAFVLLQFFQKRSNIFVF